MLIFVVRGGTARYELSKRRQAWHHSTCVSEMKSAPPLWYITQTILGAILEQALLVAAVLWLLPRFNVKVPLWGLAVLMIALAVHSYIMYRVGRPTFLLKPKVAFENIIGVEGKVMRWQGTTGYVKVQGVLWKAICSGQRLNPGDDIVVVGIERLRLVVAPKTEPSDQDRGLKDSTW